ncbi:MAG: CRTAC1 family protein [Acidobacteriota bacterium]
MYPNRSTPIALRACRTGALVAAFCLAALPALADGGVQYRDIAQDPQMGLAYERIPSPRKAILDQIRAQPDFVISRDFAIGPHKAHGAPGVAIFDFDGDKDLDLYVTNGPGAANSLFVNQLTETGAFGFRDMATEAGVAAIEQDSTGVCFGDTDNDGDQDLMVLGGIDTNRFFENLGNGTFSEITGPAGLTSTLRSTSSCAMGDVNNDGYLDIVVANTHTSWDNVLALVVPFAFNEHNELYINQGGNTFSEEAAQRGLYSLAGLAPDAAGAAGLSWVTSMVDYDRDGDVDIFVGDDQGAIEPPKYGGFPYGFFHLFENDGAGNFVDVTVDRTANYTGSWMGFAFGDWNCDQRIDFFGTNLGDYTGSTLRVGRPNENGDFASQWYLQQADGTFMNPGQGDMVASVFGWGTSSFDYDNDGDPDIVYYGGFDPGFFVDASNPGVMMQNQGCSANFRYDGDVFATSTDHARRKVQGSAVGDLNRDGFMDIVSVSHFDIPEDLPLQRHPAQYGGPLDSAAMYLETHEPTPNPETFIPKGMAMENGSLAVEINSGNNGNNWNSVELMGTKGMTANGQVNRDGIGALVHLRTPQGKAVMVPVLGGSSYASQDALAVNFGLGDERRGFVDVQWPGGTWNRLYTVRRGERVTFPEIPCSYRADYANGFGEYWTCVSGALGELRGADAIGDDDFLRFFVSAVRAYFDHRGL